MQILRQHSKRALLKIFFGKRTVYSRNLSGFRICPTSGFFFLNRFFRNENFFIIHFEQNRFKKKNFEVGHVNRLIVNRSIVNRLIVNRLIVNHLHNINTKRENIQTEYCFGWPCWKTYDRARPFFRLCTRQNQDDGRSFWNEKIVIYINAY